MPLIQILQNGQKVTVTKQQVFELAKQGKLKADSPIWVNGKETICGRIQGIVFGVEVPMPPAQFNSAKPSSPQKPDFQSMIDKPKRCKISPITLAAIILDTIVFIFFLLCSMSILISGISYKNYSSFIAISLDTYMGEGIVLQSVEQSQLQTVIDFNTISTTEREQQNKDKLQIDEKTKEFLLTGNLRDVMNDKATAKLEFKEFLLTKKDSQIKRLQDILDNIEKKIKDRGDTISAQINDIKKDRKVEQEARLALLDKNPLGYRLLTMPLILWSVILLSIMAFGLTVYALLFSLKRVAV